MFCVELEKSCPPEDSFDCSVARLPDNMRKNRFPNLLPCEYRLSYIQCIWCYASILCVADADRVVLSTDHDQPDYINACFLDVSSNSAVSLHVIKICFIRVTVTEMLSSAHKVP